MSIHQHNEEKGGRPPPVGCRTRCDGQEFSKRGENNCLDGQKF